jgi:hypothetical protein
MKFPNLVTFVCLAASTSAAVAKRQTGQQPTFEDGQPINADGSRGAAISGMQNPNNHLQETEEVLQVGPTTRLTSRTPMASDGKALTAELCPT